jgi:hypothetical protein
MSSTDTKWKKKLKRASNIEGLENKEENLKTSRIEKDNKQTKMLSDLKNRIKNIQNKRNGFTKLPHLTDVADDGGRNKEDFNADTVMKIGGGLSELTKDDISTSLNEAKKTATDEAKKKAATYYENISNFFLGRWNNLSNYPYGATLGINYCVFLIVYLQLYHLNFKEDIKLAFPGSYVNDSSVNKPSSEDNELPSEDNELPSEWGAITENIFDSLTKTLGGMLRKEGFGWIREPAYVDIKHNDFLKYLNHVARLDLGIFLRYIFIPAQVVVAITQNLIPNLNLIPILGNKNVFPIIFVMLFLFLYSSSFIDKIDKIKKIRKSVRKSESIKGGWNDWMVQYYASIPIAYFILVGFIIFIAFSLDTGKQMSDGSFFAGGLYAVIGKSLFKVFALGMSIVLSGFSAIPLAIFAMTWIIIPEGPGIPVYNKWSNAIRDNYWVPEWNVCADNINTERFMYIIRKLWNNKILISTFIVMDLVIKLNYGRGNLLYGTEIFNETKSRWLQSIPLIIVLAMLSHETTKDKPLYEYGLNLFLPIKQKFRELAGLEEAVNEYDN